MTCIDLHTHSHYSDGVLAPAELIHLAAEAGLSAVAICDHDNIDAAPEAMDAAARHGLEYITGVELSTVFDGHKDMHLLGYGFDPLDSKLCQALEEFQHGRETRTHRIIANINSLLLKDGREPIDAEAMAARVRGALGRPHIATELIHLGHAQNMNDAFENFLHPCNEPKRFLPVAEAMTLILNAGGVPVLAHPNLVTRDPGALTKICRELTPLGLAGIEAYSPSATEEDTARFITLARRHGLLVTGGSDFHGLEPGISIGTGRGNLKIPYTCFEEIRSHLPERALERDR